MNKLTTLMAAGLVSVALSTTVLAETIIGVSWSNFQEERWKTDEGAMKKVIEAAIIKKLEECKRVLF